MQAQPANMREEVKVNEVKEQIIALGAGKVEIANIAEVPFYPELRQACEQNYCGSFSKNWTCPPHCGEINELISEMKKYEFAVVFQSVYPLEDSYDIEGMEVAHNEFRALSDKVSALFDENQIESKEVKMLSAGGCAICKKCAVQTDEPCRFPLKAYSSLEAHGVQVSELAKSCGMKYINGQNTVTYFGAVFLK